MAITFDCATDRVLTLEEFVAFCEGTPRLGDPDVQPVVAEALQAACSNPRLVPDFLAGELTSLAEFQSGNTYKPPTFVVHRDKRFTVRAVVWLPVEERIAPSLFSYDEAHDHNFDFYTCGYHGPGYRTDIYEYDPDAVTGTPGERVAIRFLESAMLPRGKVMFYRASRDLHVQYPPDALSVSVNLILRREGKPRRQFDFDLAARTIKGQVNAANWHRSLFVASVLSGDARVVRAVAAIGRSNPSEAVRALAWQALIEHRPEVAEESFASAMQDGSAYVRSIVASAWIRCEDLRQGQGAA